MEVVTADQALDLPARGNRVIICLADEQDVGPVARYMDRFGRQVGIQAVRVEPGIQALVTLQVPPKIPTYLVFVDGNELARAVGTDAMMAWLEQHARTL